MAVAHKPTLTMEGSTWLEQLFVAHHRRVLRAAYRITGNMSDAEDVAQAVFMRLASSDGAAIETAESYLFRAAINGSLDLLRSRQREKQVPLDDAGDVASEAPEGSPELQVASGETKRWLRQALATLTPRSAEMFVLRYIEGLENREIARMLDASQVLVAVTLHQARAKLKKEFERQKRGIR